jgi:hypothetical protein
VSNRFRPKKNPAKKHHHESNKHGNDFSYAWKQSAFRYSADMPLVPAR